MCIVFYTVTQPGYKLILASNRDEFLDRPTLPADWHTFAPLTLDSSPSAQPKPANTADTEPDREPWVISGRDMGNPVGGTWLGLTRDLRLAVLTNIRIPPVPTPANPPSRGLLLKDFLAPPPSNDLQKVQEYLAGYKALAERYEGFNLLLFHLHPPVKGSEQRAETEQDGWGKTEIGYLSNRPVPTLVDITLASGQSTLPSQVEVGECRGLSNTPMDKPWPKVLRGEENMTRTLQQWSQRNEEEDELIERLMKMLQQTMPMDSIADLSDCTCLHPVAVGPNPDQLSKPGEKTRWYGTRVTTVVLVKDNGEVTFVERDIFIQDAQGEAKPGTGERRFEFQAEAL